MNRRPSQVGDVIPRVSRHRPPRHKHQPPASKPLIPKPLLKQHHHTTHNPLSDTRHPSHTPQPEHLPRQIDKHTPKPTRTRARERLTQRPQIAKDTHTRDPSLPERAREPTATLDIQDSPPLNSRTPRVN